MTALPSCDPAAMAADLAPVERDPWLVRRHACWGASELPVLYAARGWLPTDAITVAQRAELESAKLGKARGIAKHIARKAGLMRDKAGQSQAVTERSELALLAVWRRVYAEQYDVDPASIVHASEWPREWMPLRDSQCYALGATPDAYGRDVYDGSLVLIELKAPPEMEAWARWGLRWTVQCHGEIAVTNAARALLVCGNGWAIPDREGPVTTNVIDRDEAEIARCREAATDAMAMVEELWRVAA